MHSIDANVKRGSAELAVLSLLENGPAHGYEIAKQIEQQSGGVLRFDVASLYPLLYRMEKRGWVKARWQQTPNGRKRRCYELAAGGKKQIASLRSQWKLFFKALNGITGFQHA